MRFEKVKEVRRDNKVQKLIEKFLKSGYDKVEVINENDYDNNSKMIAAMRWVIKNYYSDAVEVSKIKDKVYLKKIDDQKHKSAQ